MAQVNLYKVLGVSHDATGDQIRKAYRKLAFQFHPDRNPGNQSDAKIREINAAYETLGDPKKRQTYDQMNNFIPVKYKPVRNTEYDPRVEQFEKEWRYYVKKCDRTLKRPT